MAVYLQKFLIVTLVETNFKSHAPIPLFPDQKAMYLLTYFMEQSPSWEANLFSASQEIHRILWNPESSLPHSQVLANCPYPEPARCSLCPHTPLPEDPS